MNVFYYCFLNYFSIYCYGCVVRKLRLGEKLLGTDTVFVGWIRKMCYTEISKKFAFGDISGDIYFCPLQDHIALLNK